MHLKYRLLITVLPLSECDISTGSDIMQDMTFVRDQQIPKNQKHVLLRMVMILATFI